MSENKSTTSKHKWFEDEMVWKCQKGRARKWTADNPSLPDWAKKNSGAVSPTQFVRIYAAASSLSELKSQLFWLSLGEIEALRIGVSSWLAAHNIQPLEPLEGSGSVFEMTDLKAMLTDGILSPVPGSELDLQLNPPEEVDEEDLDLTPTPPRPNEDPLQGKTFNEIMHLPNIPNERAFVTMMGMGKVRISSKH